MVMDVDKKYMAIMAVVCFMVVSAGFVSILDDADAAGEVSVVSYDSRAGKGGQLVLNASTTPGPHTASINSIAFSGNYAPGKELKMTRTYDAELSKPLGAGKYPGIQLKNSTGAVGTFDLSLYDVKFDANGGTGTVDPFVAYGNVSLPDGTGLTSPDTSKTFLGWSDVSGATTVKYTDAIDVKSNVTLYAVWGTAAPTTVTVTIKVNDSNMGSVDKESVDVAPGSTISITGNEITIGTEKVVASTKVVAGYTVEFDKWVGASHGGTVSSEMEITAVFKKTEDTYTVTVKSNNDSFGTVDPKTIADVPYGSKFTVVGNKLTVNGTEVTATPTANTAQYSYQFKSWSVENNAEVQGNVEVTATFEQTLNKYPVTVTVNDSTMGSADFYLDGTKIDSGTEVEYGKTVTLAISQVKGYTLTSVKFNGEVLFKEGDELKLVYSIVVGVENKFEVGFTKTTELQYDVKLTCETGNGRFIPGPNADGVYILNGESSMDFQILADFGYRIKSVTLDGIKQDFGKVSAVVPIKNIVADHEIVAEFEKADTYPIQLIGASNGKVEITGLDADGRAVEGRSITITATPDFGFYASKFLVNGVDIDTTTGAVSESRTISVDKSLDGGKIVVEVKFALAASGDEEDDPTPSPPTPAPQTGGDGGKDEAVKVAAVAAACVAVVVIALYMVVWRKD